MVKRIAAAALALALSVCACGCTAAGGASGEDAISAADEAEGWAVYWYLCASDLESDYGCATDDLIEALDVSLPPDVKVVIQTGGANSWQNDTVQSGVLQRYLYDSEGLTLLENLDIANMGKPDTLSDFLSFCKENYPADKTMLLFWDHGGGSVSGVAFDEVYGYDSLTLDEIRKALSNVYEISESHPPFELVGFDTCLMATVDMAYTLKGVAKYMVASEEIEPGGGWYYTDWLGALAADPRMDGARLGRTICETYYAGCAEEGLESNATLSLTDLGKLDVLMEAYEAFGEEALMAACVDEGFLSQFARTSEAAENYGGNSRESGYTNMVDLGHVARQCEGLLASAKDVTAALEEAVIYEVSGKYRSESTGLSFYYPLSRDPENYGYYAAISASRSFPYLYELGLTGTLGEEGSQYLKSMNVTQQARIKTLLDTDWEGRPLYINEENYACLDLGKEADSILSGISFSLYLTDEEGNVLWMGTDNDITADWKNGVFTDNFRGVWGALDGNIAFMELTYEGEDYNLYAVPALINEEQYNLEVVYDFKTAAWTVLGARKAVDANGMADKNLYQLKKGDEVQLIWYMAPSVAEDFCPCVSAVLTYDESMKFEEVALPDDTYTMIMQMRDFAGNTASSGMVDFRVEGEDIYPTVY